MSVPVVIFYPFSSNVPDSDLRYIQELAGLNYLLYIYAHRDTYLEQQQTEKLETEVRDHRDTYLEQQQTEKLDTEVRDVDRK